MLYWIILSLLSIIWAVLKIILLIKEKKIKKDLKEFAESQTTWKI